MRPNDKSALPALAGMVRRPRLFREILVALIIKTTLLFGLWWAFFSQAPAKDAVARSIATHLYGSPATAIPVSSSNKEPQP